MMLGTEVPPILIKPIYNRGCYRPYDFYLTSTPVLVPITQMNAKCVGIKNAEHILCHVQKWT
jgi:hypothetical protein